MKIPNIPASFLLAALLAPAAHASSLVFDFSTSLDPGFSDTHVAALSISNVAGGTRWTLSTNWAAGLSPAFVHFLGYTYSGSSSLASSGYTVLAGEVNAPSFGAGPAHTSAAFFQTRNDSGRFNNGESVSWTLPGTAASDFSVNYLKINAINNGGSVRFSPTLVSPVPEPSSYAMMLAGIAGLCLVRRRRQGQSQQQ